LPDDREVEITPLLRDPDPRVRATAAARSPETAHDLSRMLDDADPAERFAALAVAGPAHAEQLARAVGDRDPLLGAAALERLAEVAPDRIPEGAIDRALDSVDSRARCAALRAWSLRPDRAPRERIARALGDPASEVRSCASDALAAAGAAGVEAALPYLGDVSATTAVAALTAVAAGDHPHRRRFLSDQLRERAGRAWRAVVALAEARDQLQQRARWAHRLGAQQLVAQIGEARGIAVADVFVEVAQIESTCADPLDQGVEIGATRA
jgi:hypothetical protein